MSLTYFNLYLYLSNDGLFTGSTLQCDYSNRAKEKKANQSKRKLRTVDWWLG